MTDSQRDQQRRDTTQGDQSGQGSGGSRSTQGGQGQDTAGSR